MYHFKEIELKNKDQTKKRLIIEFTENDMEIVADYLMSDASLLDYSVLSQIDQVLSGLSKHEESNGNRYSLVIKRDTTTITDLFADLYDDFDAYESYEINTVKLRELIAMWRDETQAFYSQG